MCAVNSGCYCKQLQKAYSHPINILINPTWPQTADKPHVIAIKKVLTLCLYHVLLTKTLL